MKKGGIAMFVEKKEMYHFNNIRKYDDIWYFMNHQLQFNEPPRFKSISIGNDSKDISLNYNKVA